MAARAPALSLPAHGAAAAPARRGRLARQCRGHGVSLMGNCYLQIYRTGFEIVGFFWKIEDGRARRISQFDLSGMHDNEASTTKDVLRLLERDYSGSEFHQLELDQR